MRIGAGSLGIGITKIAIPVQAIIVGIRCAHIFGYFLGLFIALPSSEQLRRDLMRLLFSTFLIGSCLALSSAHAASPQQGERSIDGMVFLYREPVEIYWNDWKGKKLSGSQAYISGEGKTANFEGIVSLNCDSGSGYSWITASNSRQHLGMSETEVSRVVPIQAISAAFTEFCHVE